MSVLIRLRLARRVVDVSVRDQTCPTLACFDPRSMEWDGQWDCATRRYAGCPAETRIADPARYASRAGAAWKAVAS